MQLRKYKVKIIHFDKKLDAEFKLYTKQADCFVELRFRGSIVTKSNFYYLHGLTEIRRALEEKGMLIACNGSRSDVMTSGMITAMSMGTMGSLVDAEGEITQNTVNLFEETQQYHKLVSVKRQMEIKQEMINKPKK